MKKLMFAVVGFICGAIFAMIIGFGWGGWTTAGTSQKMSDEAALKYGSEVAICVSKFIKEPGHEEKLKEFKGLEHPWERAKFVEKGSWYEMPDEERARSIIAEAAAKGIETLVKQ